MVVILRKIGGPAMEISKLGNLPFLCVQLAAFTAAAWLFSALLLWMMSNMTGAGLF